MQLYLLFILFIAALSAAQSFPNDYVRLDLYPDKNFKGHRASYAINHPRYHYCFIVSPTFENKMSSLVLVNGTCEFFYDRSCKRLMFRAARQKFPVVDAAFDDRMKSFRCWV